MLKMNSECLRCQAPLQADGPALICSHECTYCITCGASLQYICPNCQGELLARPRRVKSPAAAATSTLRYKWKKLWGDA